MSAAPLNKAISLALLFAALYAVPVEGPKECRAQGAKTTDGATSRSLPSMKKFADAMEQLLKRYYKEIKRIDVSGETVRFEYNNMKFMVHLPLKTGEWQPAHEEIGPQRHGIACALSLTPGRWAGAAVMPQVFDHHYYKVLAMAPYDEKRDCHLHASLFYPESDISPTLMKDYQKLVNSFGNYLD